MIGEATPNRASKTTVRLKVQHLSSRWAPTSAKSRRCPSGTGTRRRKAGSRPRRPGYSFCSNIRSKCLNSSTLILYAILRMHAYTHASFIMHAHALSKPIACTVSSPLNHRYESLKTVPDCPQPCLRAHEHAPSRAYPHTKPARGLPPRSRRTNAKPIVATSATEQVAYFKSLSAPSSTTRRCYITSA